VRLYATTRLPSCWKTKLQLDRLLWGPQTSFSSCKTSNLPSTRNVLSSVLHDKVRLTDKSDAKHAATLLMLSLSSAQSFQKHHGWSTVDYDNFIVCAEIEKKEILDGCASICKYEVAEASKWPRSDLLYSHVPKKFRRAYKLLRPADLKAGLHVTFCLQSCMIRYVWQIRLMQNTRLHYSCFHSVFPKAPWMKHCWLR
jgi:hypothetical protein